MPDDLYQRYMDALTTYRDHRAACTDSRCGGSGRCPDGERLWIELTRRQDAHMRRIRNRRNAP
ncbi:MULTISPECIES: hypothetical protein [Streptomyces]|uniref:hypothetical protein n=1 Tax=Streptomyces TaxID=1883 RepID=UPI0003A98D46|nr:MULTISPECIES: hypothetical protein [Streptomyces]MBZ6128568.1 hypothetical protein [Streptomyces olivaceus]MBZ6162920.1 hypothetical protein [Streptomyces olivaceus]MBZ6190723.1 hypothetical protein [Streptomyces olivaceus]MBZ6211966.1 hypothetical protein [Streptomyces olivaceus]MBZ6225410.1 hypothetical protein [Streptomyces olivaceus]